MVLERNDVARAMGDHGTRVDPTTGVREHVEFFGRPDRLFGNRYAPPAGMDGGLVICPSIHPELLNAYRREVLLSRALASHGIAVQRFHYRGQGHSDGDTQDMTFDTMVEDALTAADHLRTGAEIAAPAFLGTRFGALVAAAAARHFDGVPVVFWDPLIDAERFFKDAFRASMMSDVKEGIAEPAPRQDKFAQLAADGVVDVLGYGVHNSLYESSKGRSLITELGEQPRPIFVGQIGRSDHLRPEYRRAMETWQQLGFAVRVEILRQDEISWFLTNERRLQESRQPIADASVEWLADVITGMTA